MDGLYVSYLRVSTKSQGASGLGREAQRAAVASYLNGGAWKLIGEYQDDETGKHAERPGLIEAMAHCKLTGATLLIAKLDRLSRNVHFLSGLMEAGVDFVACDMPSANKLTIHVVAAVAQEEREAISRRTREALGSIRARIASEGHHVSRAGNKITRLGNPNPAGRPDHAAGRAKVQARVSAFVAEVAPTVTALRAGGMSLQGVADRLNELHVRTARKSVWTPMAVKRVLDRAVSRPAA